MEALEEILKNSALDESIKNLVRAAYEMGHTDGFKKGVTHLQDIMEKVDQYINKNER